MKYFASTLIVLGLAGVMACASGSTDDSELSPTTSTPTTSEETEPTEPLPPVIAEPDDDAAFLFKGDQVHTFEFTVSEEDMAFLDNDPVAEIYVPATLRYKGETYLDVGLRYKGSVGAWMGCTENGGFNAGGAKTCPKLSMKVKMNWTYEDLTFHGLKKIQFHSMNNDESLMRERLSYYLFRSMGVATSRTAPARLVINGKLVGLFLIVEQIDGAFSRARFTEGGKGNVYKEVWPKHASSEIYRGALQTNEEDGSVEKMVRLANALQETDTEELPALSDQWIDRAYIMNYLAVDRTIKNDDGAMHWYCPFAAEGIPCNPHNFFWYEATESDQLWLLPWDTDHALRTAFPTHIPVPWNQPDPDCVPKDAALLAYVPANCDPLVWAWSTFRDDYIESVKTLLAGSFSFGNIRTLLDTWEEQISPYVTEAHADNPEHLSPERWQQFMNELKMTIQHQREAAQAMIDEHEASQ